MFIFTHIAVESLRLRMPTRFVPVVDSSREIKLQKSALYLFDREHRRWTFDPDAKVWYWNEDSKRQWILSGIVEARGMTHSAEVHADPCGGGTPLREVLVRDAGPGIVRDERMNVWSIKTMARTPSRRNVEAGRTEYLCRIVELPRGELNLVPVKADAVMKKRRV